MSSIKTVVIIGTSLKPRSGIPAVDVFESAVFGYDQEYTSAHHFIETVRQLHRSNGFELKIDKVVIG